MIFTQLEFFLFFAVVLFGAVVVKSNRLFKLGLLAGSFYFYAYWDWRFLGLMLGCITINFCGAFFAGRSHNQQIRKFVTGFSVISSLLILGTFKYYGFFLESFSGVLDATGIRIPAWEFLLPVGISFFTFQALSYTIDVYREDIPASSSWVDVALYVSFFPQLVAGPIVRASEFMPQLRAKPVITKERLSLGLEQFIKGFFKKAFIADHLAIFVDNVFANDQAFSSGVLVLALVAYAIQIYCDFSGYSDMAIGGARMLGYDFPRNFNHPYLATSIQDFWRRWHISLSSWLRDYLYIPLGGNRKGRARTYLNLFLTMLLGGLWHGAAWTFILWGAWHGVWLSIHKAIADRNTHLTPKVRGRPVIASWRTKGIKWLMTMCIVLVGWLLFRSSDVSQFSRVFSRILSFDRGVTWIPWVPLTCVSLVMMRHVLLLFPIGERFTTLRWGSVWTGYSLSLMMVLAIFYRPENFQPFIYFQF
ncbi:MBOAT family protein [Akkermansiaceae bacterium]|nr:MBOAT family protein [Akkermansiaceae bacterium]